MLNHYMDEAEVIRMFLVFLKLFICFFKVGLFSIGGGYATIPLIQQQVVEQYGWLSQQVFTDIITISQMTPGPLAVNTSTFVGMQLYGVVGAIVATLGCVISGIIISVLLYQYFQTKQESLYIKQIISGLRAVSIGLIAASSITLFKTTFLLQSNLNMFAILLFLISLWLLRKYQWNPMIIMVISGAIGFCYYMITGINITI